MRSLMLVGLPSLLGVVATCAWADCVVQPGAVLRIELPAGTASLKPAAVMTGVLDRPVYTDTCLAVPQGTHVRAVVGQVQKHPVGPPVLGWFRRLNGTSAKPPTVTIQSVEMDLPGAAAAPVKAHFVRMENERHVEAAAHKVARSRHPMLVLEVDEPLRTATPAAADLPRAMAGVVPAGTHVRVDVLAGLSSARNHDGDAIRARVAEPVVADGKVIVPEGSVLEGVVAHSKRARRPYRSGRMRVSFRWLRLPSGERAEVAVTPSAGDFAGATKLDSEGGLTGGALNRKRALLNVGLAYLTGKILDDLLEESAKAAMGEAVAGSAATAARYLGLASGAFVFLMHRGREVSLGPQTQLELTFTREVRIVP